MPSRLLLLNPTEGPQNSLRTRMRAAVTAVMYTCLKSGGGIDLTRRLQTTKETTNNKWR